MKDQNEGKLKKTWIAPEISVIQGLDSCVEFLYLGKDKTPIGINDPNDLPPSG
jgi:hypothetical protein